MVFLFLRGLLGTNAADLPFTPAEPRLPLPGREFYMLLLVRRRRQPISNTEKVSRLCI
jgi:hypothetical protein